MNINKMISIEEIDKMPLKHWAKTIAIDNDIIDEINSINIELVFPKKVTKLEDWVITQVHTYTTNKGRKAVVFYAQVEIDGETFTQRIRIYTPHFPRIKDLNQYLGSTIVGANFMCSVKLNGQNVLIARYIQVIKKDGLKSNPIIQLDTRSKELLEKNRLIHVDNYEDHGQMSNDQFIDRYFPDRNKKDFIPSK